MYTRTPLGVSFPVSAPLHGVMHNGSMWSVGYRSSHPDADDRCFIRFCRVYMATLRGAGAPKILVQKHRVVAGQLGQDLKCQRTMDDIVRTLNLIHGSSDTPCPRNWVAHAHHVLICVCELFKIQQQRERGRGRASGQRRYACKGPDDDMVFTVVTCLYVCECICIFR